MKISFVTDYVCPYCLVTKTALEKALAQLGLQAEWEIIPFELTREPFPRVDTWSDPVRRAHYTLLNEPCKLLDLPMHIPPHVVPRPYTRLAFEGRFFAQEHGLEQEWNDAVYHAYFMDEQDIGSKAVLTALAKKIGLDSDAFTEALDNGTYTARQHEAANYSRDVLQVRGVPRITIDGETIPSDAFTVEAMVRFLKGLRSQRSGNGFCCGVDGC